MEEIKKKIISELPEATTIENLYTLGTDKNDNSVKVPINLLKGNKGDKGDAPFVGTNNNWWVGTADTGVPSVIAVSQETGQDTVKAPSLKLFTDEIGMLAPKTDIYGDSVFYTPNGALPNNIPTFLHEEADEDLYNTKYLKYNYYLDSNGKNLTYPITDNRVCILNKLPVAPNTRYSISVKGVANVSENIKTFEYSAGANDDTQAVASHIVSNNKIEFVTGSITTSISLMIKVMSEPWNFDYIGILQVIKVNNLSLILGTESYNLSDVVKYRAEIGNLQNIYNKTYLYSGAYLSANGALVQISGSNFIVLNKIPITPNVNHTIELSNANPMVSNAKVFLYDVKDAQIATEIVDVAEGKIIFNSGTHTFLSLMIKVVNATWDYDYTNTLQINAPLVNHILLLGNEEIQLNKADGINADTNEIEELTDKGTFIQGIGIWRDGTEHAYTNGLSYKFHGLEPNANYLFDFGKEINVFPLTVSIYEGSATTPTTKCISNPYLFGDRYVPIKTGNDIISVGVWLSGNLANYGDFDFSTKFKFYKMPAAKVGTVDISRTRIDHTNEPQVHIPEPEWIKLNMYGKTIDAVSPDIRVPLIYEYEDSNGHYFKKNTERAIQGNSSAEDWVIKKNYKDKFTNADGSKFELKIGTWLPRTSLHLKADWLDDTRARNACAVKLFHQVYKTREFGKRYPWEIAMPYDIKSKDFEKRFYTGALGSADFIPCVMSYYGVPYGVYSFAMNSFFENFNGDKNNANHFVFKGATDFETTLDKSWWEELKVDKEGEKLPDEVFAVVKSFIDEVKSSTRDTFKEICGRRSYLPNLLDYYCTCVFLNAYDNNNTNMIWVTYDGVKFFWMPWDLDHIFGMQEYALKRQPDADWLNPKTSKFWRYFQDTYLDEIKLRYAELRKTGVFTVDNVEKLFNGYMQRFPVNDFRRDINVWGNINFSNTGNYTSIYQLVDHCRQRIIYLDDKFNYIQ